MKTRYMLLLAIALLTAACAAGLTKAERMELAKYRDADRQARLQHARDTGYQPPGPGGLPTTTPTPPAVSGPTAIGGGSGAAIQGQAMGSATAILRGQAQAYICAVGSEPRQATLGRKLRLQNQLHRSYVALEIEGRPVYVAGGVQRPDTGEWLLPPNSTCYVETGRNQHVQLVVREYQNFGTTASVMLDVVPDRSYSWGVKFWDQDAARHDITSRRPWN